MLNQNQQLKLIGLAVVILLCYSLSAIFQEKVLRKPYGSDDNEERFSFTFAFTAVQCIFYAIVSKGKNLWLDFIFNFRLNFQELFCLMIIQKMKHLKDIFV